MFYASVKFANLRDIEEGRREKMVEERALVDNGATFTTVPRSLAKKLALPIMGKVKVRTASGEEALDQSYAYTEASGKSTVAPMLVSDKMDKTLLGVFTLEALGLTVDISTGKLKETEVLLL